MADIWINILGDASKLKGALDGAGKNVTNFSEKIGKIGRTMTIAGGIITGAFAAIVKKTADVGDQFDKMSLRTGVSAEDLSELAYAADICGADIGTVENSLRFLGKGMKEASEGTGEAKDAFEELDISVTDVDGNLRPTVEVMKEAATKLATMTDKTRQAALAGEIFGSRYGTKLLPLLKQGGEGIEELMEKAKELGITVSTEASIAAADFNDRLTDLKGSLAGAGRTIGDVLIPALTPLIEKITEIVGKIAAWARENPELVSGIIKVAAVIGVAAAVGGPILMAAAAFSAVSGAIIAIGTIATGPIGLVILAIVGLAAAWKTNFLGIRDITKKVFDAIKKIFSGLVGFVSGIKDKLSNILGKIGSAISSILTKIGLLKEGTEEAGTVKITPKIPIHQTGISYVPRTGIAMLHQGERVLTKEENITYDKRKKEINININNPVVRNDNDITKIKQQVEVAFWEFVRQYGRSGYELPV